MLPRYSCDPIFSRRACGEKGERWVGLNHTAVFTVVLQTRKTFILFPTRNTG